MIPYGLIFKLVAVAGLAVAVAFFMHHYNEERRAEGRAEVQAKWDADKAARMEQVSRINQERVDAVARADELDRQAQRNRAQAFSSVRDRIPAGPADAALARRLLNDAVRAANGQPAASTSEPAPDPAAPAEPPSCDFGPWLRWGEQVAELYAAAREQVIGWNKFYDDLRAAK